jgi:hypothetical protein
METPPEEAANPVLLAFKKITTQLEQLEERERRAEERERHRQEREQRLIERQSKLHESINNILLKSSSFQRSVLDIETRIQTYLDDYFKHLPKESIVVEEQRFSIDSKTKNMFYIFLLGMFVSGLLVYFASPRVDVARLEYQSQRISALEAKLKYMEAKNPKTAKSYEAEQE